ncbi:Hsp20/alpha crystallin family protein [Patescibacteria group bacterium]|nr:Hsp20/alpha crystallin family protein [Patescibacteria group bacterium]
MYQEEETLIGIGEIPEMQKKQGSSSYSDYDDQKTKNNLSPHIRYDDQMSKIADELNAEVSQNAILSNDEGELAVDVYETADYIYIVAPVAGVQMDNIDLSITEDVLQIRGRRSLGRDVPPQNYLIRECFWGDFSRSVILPPNADPTTISATFKNAVLKIKIGKFDQGKTRRIEIK